MAAKRKPASIKRTTSIALAGSYRNRGVHEPVDIRLDQGCTVLVGKNGAGKTSLVEAFVNACDTALGRKKELVPLCRVNFETTDSPASTLVWQFLPRGTVDMHAAEWDITFAQGPGRPKWSQNGSRVKLGTQELRMAAAQSVLAQEEFVSHEVSLCRALLQNVRFVPSGTVFGDGRRYLYLEVSGAKREAEAARFPESRFERLQRLLYSWGVSSPGLLQELNRVCARMGLISREIRFQILSLGKHSQDKNSKDLVVAFAGSHQLSQHSDGTLRLIEILACLVGSAPGSLIFVEEPETGVHPGMLSKLLHEVEAYSQDRQVVLTTHSPSVLDRFDASTIRLVERTPKGARVEEMSKRRKQEVSRYLEEDGVLSDYVFGGAMDDTKD